jgi:NitT/TauT family transport system ATP-binding protein
VTEVTTTSDALIRASNLSKTYRSRTGDEVHALAESSFELNDGSFMACVGPSGCGKTTLLKILAGLLSKSSGAVTLAGEEISQPHPDIAIVFQSPVLLPWLTVLDNVLLPIRVRRRVQTEDLERARSLIEMVGLSGFENKYPFELSGGMQQRNSIIRALVQEPKMLLMDEPFGALDAMTRDQMGLELQRIWMETRKSVFFITHSIPEAVFLGDNVMVMGSSPGHIQRIVPIEAPRPRSLEWMASAEFGRIVLDIRKSLRADEHTGFGVHG